MGCLNKARPPPTNLSPAEYKAVKLLKEDDLIVIALADKGKVTVVINNKDYDGKMRSPLVGGHRHLQETSKRSDIGSGEEEEGFTFATDEI